MAVARRLAAEGDHEVVVVELAAVGPHVAFVEVDLAHLGVDELDAVTGEPAALAPDRLGAALAGHHTQVAGG